MSSNNPNGIRTPGETPERKPIPAGSFSTAAIARNALGLAGDPNPDESIPEAVAEAVAIKHEATGRRPNGPPGKI